VPCQQGDGGSKTARSKHYPLVKPLARTQGENAESALRAHAYTFVSVDPKNIKQ